MSRNIFPVLASLLVGCTAPAGDHAHEAGDHAHGGEEESWAVTAWGEHFEIFAEAALLRVGVVSKSHTHVTILDGFLPLREGMVAAILRDSTGAETVFRQTTPLRDGIFDIALEPARAGDYELRFRVEAGGQNEDIPAGRVRVGDQHGGGILPGDGSPSAGQESVGFLKEQQWRMTFATEWAELGSIRATVRGPGRIRPRAGGEVVLSAPQDGLVIGEPWPYPGRAVREGEPVFRLVPLISGDRSLAELEAQVTGLRSELGSAEARLTRLEGLVSLDAVSSGEVEAARSLVESLRARMAAAEKDLITASSARRGAAADGESVALQAPFAGRVSQVMVTRGEIVSAGQPLGRLVQPDPVWVEVSLRPGDVALVDGEASSLHFTGLGGSEGLTFGEGDVRFVSRSPEVDPSTGAVAVLFEVEGAMDRLIPGTAATVEIGLREAAEGVVIPESAVVDDSGIPVVYEQESGEGFVRREIEVLARQGQQLLVRGLHPGVRIVTKGGATIRRATLVSSGEIQGHVH